MDTHCSPDTPIYHDYFVPDPLDEAKSTDTPQGVPAEEKPDEKEDFDSLEREHSPPDKEGKSVDSNKSTPDHKDGDAVFQNKHFTERVDGSNSPLGDDSALGSEVKVEDEGEIKIPLAFANRYFEPVDEPAVHSESSQSNFSASEQDLKDVIEKIDMKDHHIGLNKHFEMEKAAEGEGKENNHQEIEAEIHELRIRNSNIICNEHFESEGEHELKL